MSRKSKVTEETKLHFVQKYLSGKGSLVQISKEAGVYESTFRAWLRLYQSGDSLASSDHNRVYPPEIKLKAVQEYLLGKDSLRKICFRYQIRSTGILRSWIKVYNNHGSFDSRKYSGGGSYMRASGRQVTLEERVQIAQECISSGRNYGAVAAKWGVSYHQVRNWTLKYEQYGQSGLEDRRGIRTAAQKARTAEEAQIIRNAQLEAENRRLKMELALLKKSLEEEGLW